MQEASFPYVEFLAGFLEGFHKIFFKILLTGIAILGTIKLLC